MHKLRLSFIIPAVLLIACLILVLLPSGSMEQADSHGYPGSPIRYADMSKSGKITNGNFSEIKSQYLNQKDLEERSKSYKADTLIEPPIAELNPAMPSVGNIRILVFAVSFPDYGFSDSVSDPADTLNSLLFEKKGPMAPCYPYESITAYYDRASYGRLHLTGDVFNYQAACPVKEYVGNQVKLFDELMAAFDDQIDYRDYDGNKDGVLDGIVVILPEKLRDRDDNGDFQKDWWPLSMLYDGSFAADGVHIKRYCIGAYPFYPAADFTAIWIHEIGHEMGLPDYYRYDVDENDPNQTIYGLNGDAGWEMMDEHRGDYSSFSKLMYGWMTNDEVKIYHGGTQTFQLYSAQCRPSCILIPREPVNDFCSEFFLLEYLMPESNYTSARARIKRKDLFSSSGIRILHCDSHITINGERMELSWNNNGLLYDTSNMKQRVLRLVNEAEGGALFEFEKQYRSTDYSGFRWYDSEGNQSIDPNLTVSISSLYADAHETNLSDRYCLITISDKAAG